MVSSHLLLVPLFCLSVLIPTDLATEISENVKFWPFPDKCAVTFHLYKRGEEVAQGMVEEEGKIFKGLLDPKEEVVFLVHGFYNGCDKEFTTSVRGAYAKARPGVQVVTVCYRSAEVPWFMFEWTRTSIDCVAKKIKTVMNRVNAEYNVEWENITLIGHSFGGQVAGETGNLLNRRLKWLMALDPTGFTFHGPFPSRLTHRSAQHVIVVHTGKWPLGKSRAVGTADFYVNGGEKQPGCRNDGFLAWINIIDRCSHQRSFKLFISVISNETAYLAQQCDDHESFKTHRCTRNPTVFLNTRVTELGKFYFDTEGQPPFLQIARPKEDGVPE